MVDAGGKRHFREGIGLGKGGVEGKEVDEDEG
jgi:hypothetical protein